MKLFRAYQKTRFFLIVNILGLAVGLAAAIMLTLFVVNEWSYDRHLANRKRIVSLNIAREGEENIPINLRRAYTELPGRVAGIEALAQIYLEGGVPLRTDGNEESFRSMVFFTDPEFLTVFPQTFVAGTARSALADKSSAVLTRTQAEAMFGSAEAAVGRTISSDGMSAVVSAVVEPMPQNTHFSFDVLVRNDINPMIDMMEGAEWHTFILIKKDQNVEQVRQTIASEYTTVLEPWAKKFEGKITGDTEMLSDIYLRGKASWTMGRRGSMQMIWMLAALAFFILAFAISNFVNLFAAQGETRMREIGVRKTFGAQPRDLVRQLFGEVALLVGVAFALGLLLAVELTPWFAQLIGRPIDMTQFLSPMFVGCMAALLVVTVVLSASYTSFYLSRQNPLDILGKRIAFSKSRLTTAIVCFQSAVTIVLITMIVLVNRQTAHLRSLPIGYNPKDVMMVWGSTSLGEQNKAVLDELRKLPMVEAAATGEHIIGRGGSGQSINRIDAADGDKIINEYRIGPDLGALIGFEMAEGEFFNDQTPGTPIVLNQAAVRMLELPSPVVGRQVRYKGSPATVTGVVRDFIYGHPVDLVQPLVMSRQWLGNLFYVRVRPGTNRNEVRVAVEEVLKSFDGEFIMSPVWSEDLYESKFGEINHLARIIFIGSILSVVLAMMGLLAVHLYKAARRTREIAVRRINGATRGEIFALLSRDMLRWIAISALAAIPAAWWLAEKLMMGIANRVPLSWYVFVIPVAVQMLMALAVTSGVSIRVSSRNPVESLKSE